MKRYTSKLNATTGSCEKSTSPLDWMDKHNMYMLHQAWENNLKLTKSLPCKNWKVENNLLTKFQATKCVN